MPHTACRVKLGIDEPSDAEREIARAVEGGRSVQKFSLSQFKRSGKRFEAVRGEGAEFESEQV